MVGHNCLRGAEHALKLNVFTSTSTSSTANSKTGADLVDGYEQAQAVLIPTSVHSGVAQGKGEKVEGEGDMHGPC